MRLITPLLTLALFTTGLAAHAASPVPEKGQSMSSVLKHYGEPKQRIAAVGKPPISRWVYPEFTVYFEHKHTIHSVQHQKRITPTATR